MLDARLGDLDAQLPRLRRARAIAENVAAHRVRLRALHCESSVNEAYGRLAEAEELARLGLRTARELGPARSAGAPLLQDPLQLPRLEVEVRAAQGRQAEEEAAFELAELTGRVVA